ncbi:ubiquitin carboxy terminal hydrolase Ubp9 [Schizosaccharomyces japonicus yFS275]|uniref:ubiquitinyl hydrolase 1 n=1 Tax=Schizosaccharomyces japonicus (strain yFS275 / FY16936) TaxID=402676 RepID=B6JVY1_SCHJY|nr:ubiquitin carboxy terminal hydrolase Ubp9 [Schizosaccharomyces japonicus yFS275]EEB05532.1 ubiquitin carboxy terminal hydrolase Ubp9 [Schizosaccharomyces japonicus yFS275]
MSFLRWMGMSSQGSSSRRKDSGDHPMTPNEYPIVPSTDRFFGLTNFGNTCYVSSVLVSLFHLKQFRKTLSEFPSKAMAPNFKSVCGNNPTNEPASSHNHHSHHTKKKDKGDGRKLSSQQSYNSCGCADILTFNEIAAKHKISVDESGSQAYGMDENIFTALKDLYESIATCECRYGVCSPTRFIQVLRRDNELFRATQQQDAHEFLYFLLNAIEEIINEYYRSHSETSGPNWIHSLFGGILTSETKCLTCENVTSREESFLDLSIDIEDFSSVSSCLRTFSSAEMLSSKNKFHCDACRSLQEAEKRIKLKQLPQILALHLKRFNYSEQQSGHAKLFHTVAYPSELRLPNTTEDAEDADRLYELSAIIVHIGGGPHHGHYVAIVRTTSCGWVLFDDETVTPVDDSFIRKFFGDQPGEATAYVLFYTAKEEETPSSDDGSMSATPTTSNSNDAYRSSQSPASNSLTSQMAQLDILPPSHITASPTFSDTIEVPQRPAPVPIHAPSAARITTPQRATTFSSRSKSFKKEPHSFLSSFNGNRNSFITSPETTLKSPSFPIDGKDMFDVPQPNKRFHKSAFRSLRYRK